MGGSNSTSSSSRPNNSTKNHHDADHKEFDCNPYIATSDINRALRQNNPCFDDRILFQDAKILIAKESDWIFRHCEIRVIGTETDYIFYAGERSNVYVIMNDNSTVETKCKSKGLRLTARNGARKVGSWLCSAASKVVGAIGYVAATACALAIEAAPHVALAIADSEKSDFW